MNKVANEKYILGRNFYLKFSLFWMKITDFFFAEIEEKVYFNFIKTFECIIFIASFIGSVESTISLSHSLGVKISIFSKFCRGMSTKIQKLFF